MRTIWPLSLDDDGRLIALELSSVWRSIRLVKVGPTSSKIGVSARIGKVIRLPSDMLDVGEVGNFGEVSEV